MKEKKNIVIALIVGLCIVAAAVALGWGLAHFRSGVEHSISATGSSSMNFESDLIVWRGDFSANADTSEAAYRQIKKDSDSVKKFLKENGVSENDISFSSVNIHHVTRDFMM